MPMRLLLSDRGDDGMASPHLSCSLTNTPPDASLCGKATCAIAEAVAPFLACPTANTDVLTSCAAAFTTLIASPVCAAALARAAVCDTAFLCQNVAPVIGFPGCARVSPCRVLHSKVQFRYEFAQLSAASHWTHVLNTLCERQLAASSIWLYTMNCLGSTIVCLAMHLYFACPRNSI